MEDQNPVQNMTLTNPRCDSCEVTFTKMEYMNTHMKVKHDESENMRIIRLTQAVKTVVGMEQNSPKVTRVKRMASNDCSECGLIFSSDLEQKNHFVNYHAAQKGEKQSPCGICGEITDKSRLEEHIKKNTTKIVFKQSRLLGILM